MQFIADSGFIVSRWSKTPRRKQWAIRHWETATLPMLTSAANLQAAGWLLLRHLDAGGLNSHPVVIRAAVNSNLNCGKLF